MGPFSSIRAPFGGSLLRYRNHRAKKSHINVRSCTLNWLPEDPRWQARARLEMTEYFCGATRVCNWPATATTRLQGGDNARD